MFENRGSGWWPIKPYPSRPRKLRVPYGIAGLSIMTKRERRYLKVNNTVGGGMHTSPYNPNPNNVPRKFGW